ncbi:glycoside hydrolase family 3 N-terminal domain-containing protein [Agromyces cerinus]|uniref:glycoside hydrolase family 3 N-terminal domain-containing protein n=1 Tax=Agromyces cerinus TaxID=33878 RepID=UPI000A6B540D
MTGSGARTGQTETLDYRDRRLPVADRVADLIGRMTLDEKIGQMMQLDARDDLERSILDMHVGSLLHASSDRLRLAHELVASTRLGIPILVADDCIHGHSFWEGATIFPTQLAMAASWNPTLLEAVARSTAVEAAATGIHWTFSPVLCIARDLRWGRIGETFGEDPYLIGELASAMVKGYQGRGLADTSAILATAKHFAGYSETQGGRDASEGDLSRRKLRSWFLPPFERVAREGCASFMLGYQSIDGVPITMDDWLLGDVLRGEWGFTGTLVTDWDNVGRMVWEQRVHSSHVEASAAAVRAGNDVIMATPGFFAGAQEAFRRGLIGEADLDRAVARILRLKFELGLFENPRVPDEEAIAVTIGCDAHREVNLEIARRSVTLLRNDGTLPLADDERRGPARIAVVGSLADDAQNQLGDWAGGSGQAGWLEGQPRDLICTVLDGLRERAPAGCVVEYARGAEIVALMPDPAGEHFPDGQPRPRVATSVPVDERQLAEAVACARSADVIVCVVGDTIDLVGEGRSTATLELLGGQIALLDALAATGVPLVVVLMASKPMVLPASALNANALLWVGSPGMEGGRALAEVLLGECEPSGRLPISFARHVGQQPTYYNQVRGQHGDRYADLTQEPAFVFGEGMSYSTIEYGPVQLASADVGVDDCVNASIEVVNTGSRLVRETVQLYVSDLVTSVSWADQELKAFQQIDVAPGERTTVDFAVPVADLTIVDASGRRVVEPGEFELRVGPSSLAATCQRARFRVVALAGPMTCGADDGNRTRAISLGS